MLGLLVALLFVVFVLIVGWFVCAVVTGYLFCLLFCSWGDVLVVLVLFVLLISCFVNSCVLRSVYFGLLFALLNCLVLLVLLCCFDLFDYLG